MPDLSQVQGRQTTQNRLTNNRDSVLPNRRDLDTPNAVVRADMRNAFRGDDADEVRRALGLVNQAVDGVMDIRKASMARQAKTDAATGGLDAAAGKAYDPAMAKSKAYQDAYYKVSSEQKQTTWETGIESQVTAMVNQGAHIEDIHKFVMDSVSAHATEAKDIYPSDEAKLHVAESTLQFSTKLEAKLTTAIKARTDKALVDGRAATVIAALNDGRALDFEASIKPLLDAGIAPEVAKESIRHAVTAVALDPNHPRPELLMELMSSTQADGKTPSHSAEEQLQLEQSYLQAENLQKKKEKDDKEDRQSALTLKWYDAAVKGQVVDDEIDAAVKDGTLTPQEGVTFRGTFGRLRDDEREGEANDEAVLNLHLALAKPHPNYASIRAQAAQAYNSGKLGTGLAAKKAFVGLMTATAHDSMTAAESRRGGNDPDSVADGKWLLGKLLPVERDDGLTDPDSARMFIQAKAEWRTRVSKGESPTAAADAVSKVWGPRVAGLAKAPAPTTGAKKTTFKYDNNGNLK